MRISLRVLLYVLSLWCFSVGLSKWVFLYESFCGGHLPSFSVGPNLWVILCGTFTVGPSGGGVWVSPSDFLRRHGTILLDDFGIVQCEIVPEFDNFTRVIPILQGMTKSVLTCSQQELFVPQCMSEIEQSKWQAKVRNGKVCQG